MKAQLKIVLNGKEQFAELTMNKPVTVGRTKKADIVTDDPLMSGVHCRFILKADRLEIYDMESKNGIYLNGIKVLRSEIFVNDTIKVGSSVINLEPMRMDPDSTSTLTFPGPFKERVEHELKIDYTGAHSVGGKDDFNARNSNSQQSIRKKLIKPAPPTKAQIKSQNKGKATFALIIDLILLVAFAGLIPLKIIDWMSKQAQVELGSFVMIKADIDHNRLVILGFMVVIMAAIFSLINFRKKGFSMGERIAGIPSLMTQKN